MKVRLKISIKRNPIKLKLKKILIKRKITRGIKVHLKDIGIEVVIVIVRIDITKVGNHMMKVIGKALAIKRKRNIREVIVVVVQVVVQERKNVVPNRNEIVVEIAVVIVMRKESIDEVLALKVTEAAEIPIEAGIRILIDMRKINI